MARKAEEKKHYPENWLDILAICRNVETAGPNLSLKSENPEGNGVWFRVHHGATRKSYGEKITITLTPVGDGTDVHILSEVGMPTQLFDGGTNKNNVDMLFGFIEYNLNQLHAQRR